MMPREPLSTNASLSDSISGHAESGRSRTPPRTELDTINTLFVLPCMTSN